MCADTRIKISLSLVNAALLLFAAVSLNAAAKDSGVLNLENDLRKPCQELSRKLEGKVCVMDFSESGDSEHTSEFGQVVADLISNQLVNQRGRKYAVVERRVLVKIMRDSILFGNDPQTIVRLQREAGMDILVSGNYSDAGGEIAVSIKAVSAKTGTVLASGGALIKKTPGLEKMIAHRFKQFGIPNNDSPPSDSGDVEGEVKDERDILELETGVFYEGGDGKLYPVREGMVLNSKDNYCLYLKPKRDCYAYIYQVDSAKKVFKLFPNKKLKTGLNPIRGKKECWIPNEAEFLFLDENPGREEIYILATKVPAVALEDISEITISELKQTIKTMGVGGTRESVIVQKVKGTKTPAMEVIARKLTVRGDFVHKLTFIHR